MNIAEKINQLIDEWYEVQNASEEIRLNWEDRVLTALFPIRYDSIGDSLKKLTDALLLSDNKFSSIPIKEIQLDLFKQQTFSNYMEFFTRELSENTYKNIKESVKDEIMALQSESYIESFGKINKMSTILSLKKSPEDVVAAFNNLGIDLSGYKFLNVKLLLTYYHRVHSPVSGQIKRMIPIPKEEDIFGNNSLWVVNIYNEKLGDLYLLLVGESQIQDFNFKVKENDVVEIFDELGNFDWGSQTILLYDGNKMPKKLNLKVGQRYFVGSKIF